MFNEVCVSESAGSCSFENIAALVPAPCTESTYSVVTTPEFTLAMQSPFNLTIDQGSALAAIIVLVWGVAYGYRMLRSSLDPQS